MGWGGRFFKSYIEDFQELGREGQGESLFNGYRISVLQDERVLEMNSADGGTTNVDVLNVTELYTQK